MFIWIDATHTKNVPPVFGLSPLERHLRGLQQLTSQALDLNGKVGGKGPGEKFIRKLIEDRVRARAIWVELPEGEAPPEDIDPELVSQLPIEWRSSAGSVRERLQRALHEADGAPLIALSGTSILDQRITDYLLWAPAGNFAFLDDGETGDACLRLVAPLPDDVKAKGDLREIAREARETAFASRFGANDLDAYVRKLRKKLPPYILSVRDERSRDEVERFLFESNYKGSTDFLTRWVFPPLVWRMVKALADLRVHPNTVTLTGIACCIAAIPLFASGYWAAGLLAAYVMAVLDSVDGKLARVTFQSSPQGDVLDHGTDIVHPPLWYTAWAWGLSGGDVYSPLFAASLALTGFYVADRLTEKLFKSCAGRSVHSFTPLDVKIRTFISRRNTNLALFTLALPLGYAVEAFYFIVAWQLATLLYHGVRVAQVWDDREKKLRNVEGAIAGGPIENTPAPRR